MKNEFLIAITQLSAEKNLPREVVFQAVEAALVSAFKKDSQATANVVVRIHPSTGEVKVFTQKDVVETVTDEQREITLSEALRLKPEAAIGDVVEFETTPQNAGRIAAQTAKQVVLQRLREAEREVVYEEYAGRAGDIVSGIVQRVEPKQVIIDLGNAEAVLPAGEQVRSEHHRPGQRMKFYLLEVFRTAKGPQLVVSRTHRNLLRRLFELEVPEIYNGAVEIKAISREPGYRSKVAVAARQEGVDPVGSCVGLRGIRIQNIVSELNGERIDVVLWHPDSATFVANALSPAQVLSVEIEEAEKTATVVVPDRQLSLAIGKEGQNARLAAKLTGWRIDIKSATAAEAERAEREAARAAREAQRAEAQVEEAAGAVAAQAEQPAVEEALAPAAAASEPTVRKRTAAAGRVPVAETEEEAEAAEKEEVELPGYEAEELLVEEAPRPVEAEVQAPPSAGPQIRFAEDVLGDRDLRGKKKSKRTEKDDGSAPAKAKKGKRAHVSYEEPEEEDAYQYLQPHR